MKKATVRVCRYIYNTEGDRNIIGDLYINDDSDPFCYTLEDELRPEGVKVHGQTAIPAGTYKTIVRYSPRFKRDTFMLYNDINEKGVKFINGKGEKDFYYVLIHGGNDSTNTEGCILVAYNSDGKRIWGTAEKDLTSKLKEFDEVEVIVEDRPLTYHGRKV
jgi:hypothetical protein